MVTNPVKCYCYYKGQYRRYDFCLQLSCTTSIRLTFDHPHAHNFRLRHPQCVVRMSWVYLLDTICREVMMYACRARQSYEIIGLKILTKMFTVCSGSMLRFLRVRVAQWRPVVSVKRMATSRRSVLIWENLPWYPCRLWLNSLVMCLNSLAGHAEVSIHFRVIYLRLHLRQTADAS